VGGGRREGAGGGKGRWEMGGMRDLLLDVRAST